MNRPIRLVLVVSIVVCLSNLLSNLLALMKSDQPSAPFLAPSVDLPTGEASEVHSNAAITSPQSLQYHHYEIIDKRENSTACEPLSDHPPRLELLHIPKTGGSALEVLAASNNVLWGLCHWKDQLYGHVCPDHPNRTDMHPIRRLYNNTLYLSNWHVPLYLFSMNQEPHFYNPYQGADLFVVVRHPYSRLVSEGNFDKRIAGPRNLNRRLALGMRTVRSATPGSKEYFYGDAHYLPQRDYLIQHDNNKQHINILRYEHLQDDFACLLQRYKLDWGSLPPRSNVARRGFTLKDLTEKTKRLAREVYAKDFELFGYEP